MRRARGHADTRPDIDVIIGADAYRLSKDIGDATRTIIDVVGQ